MNNKTVLMGVLLGVLGAGLLVAFVAMAGGSEPTVAAWVADEDLAPGTDADAVAGLASRTEVPESVVPASRITDLDELAGLEVVRAVGAGEVLTSNQFAAAGPVAGGLVVPAGYEAISVEADPAPGVEGYVTPGARVNVYATLDEAGEDGDDQDASPVASDAAATQLVLGHVDVLAVTRGTLTGQAREAQEQDADSRVVLLLQVRPDDAPVLIHAQRQGQLWFSLVNIDDDAPDPQQIQLGDLQPGQRAAEIRAAREQQVANDDTSVEVSDEGGGEE